MKRRGLDSRTTDRSRIEQKPAYSIPPRAARVGDAFWRDPRGSVTPMVDDSTSDDSDESIPASLRSIAEEHPESEVSDGYLDTECRDDDGEQFGYE